MNLLDLLMLVVDNLSRRKGRVGLTAVGVIIGTTAIVLLVSLGSGLQQNAANQFAGIGDLTRITVNPIYGEYDPDTGQSTIRQPLTDQTVLDIAALPHVAGVVPQDYLYGWGVLKVGRLEGGGSYIGLGTDDASLLGMRAQAGSLTLAPGTVILGSAVAANLWDPRPRPGSQPPVIPPAADLVDQNVTIAFIKYSNDGTEVRKNVRARIGGVLTEIRDEPDWAIYMPLAQIDALNLWYTGQRVDREKTGYQAIIVKVEDVREVIDVADLIKAMGYNAYTLQSIVQGVTGFYTLLQVIFGGVGAVALLVAAIGIANTMAMSILERTREIGLMKAVGATNRQVLTVFLGESAGIGFLGGMGGVMAGWGLGQVVNVLVMAYLAGQSVTSGAPPPTVAVATPVWLPPFSLVFATLVGLVSGLYPALRAATLSPIVALKYE